MRNNGIPLLFLFVNPLLWKVLSSYKINKLRTCLYRTFNPCPDPRLVFIFGCQRSGTTMLRDFIGFDPRVKDYGEGDPPFFWQRPMDDPLYIRLVHDVEVERLRMAERSELVLIKPLHDSQRAVELLGKWPRSKGIWIYRHYREVILSHQAYYKGRYSAEPYLNDLWELNEKSWKAEYLGAEMKDFIRTHRHLATNSTVAFALFWLARNSLLFTNKHPNLITLPYSAMVRQPQLALEVIGHHLEMDFDPRYAEFPEHRERNKPLPHPLPCAVEVACEKMLSALAGVSALQS